MDTDINSLWEVLLWSFWIFIWVSALVVWFHCIADLFSDSTISGWGKAGWALVLVFIPWFGALIYIITRRRGMGERQSAALAAAQDQQEQYIRSVTGASQSPVDQTSSAQALLDAGAITDEEFRALKTKALA